MNRKKTRDKKIKINEKMMLSILLSIFIILTFLYVKIINIHLRNQRFEKDSILISEKNQEDVFSLNKIILISSANAVDHSEEKNLQDLSLFQFTDMALIIDNGEELTNKNTVKSLSIDNIEINTKTKKGIQSLNYKNYEIFGKTSELISDSIPDRIDFNIVYTNEENENANYNEPTFYTDCSNPITLEYINKDLVTGYKMGENTSIFFDGKILKSAGVELKDIECYLKFKINIENNLNEKYSCWIGFYIPLNDVFEGNSIKSRTLDGEKFRFFCNPLI